MRERLAYLEKGEEGLIKVIKAHYRVIDASNVFKISAKELHSNRTKQE
jgi:hypothetical protein